MAVTAQNEDGKIKDMLEKLDINPVELIPHIKEGLTEIIRFFKDGEHQPRVRKNLNQTTKLVGLLCKQSLDQQALIEHLYNHLGIEMPVNVEPLKPTKKGRKK